MPQLYRSARLGAAADHRLIGPQTRRIHDAVSCRSAAPLGHTPRTLQAPWYASGPPIDRGHRQRRRPPAATTAGPNHEKTSQPRPATEHGLAWKHRMWPITKVQSPAGDARRSAGGESTMQRKLIPRGPEDPLCPAMCWWRTGTVQVHSVYALDHIKDAAGRGARARPGTTSRRWTTSGCSRDTHGWRSVCFRVRE